METNLIKITGQSGTGKSSIAYLFKGMLETFGYSVAVVDGRRHPDKEDKQSDFVIWTRITKSERPQITFAGYDELNDFHHALCGAKQKGSVGKIGRLPKPTDTKP